MREFPVRCFSERLKIFPPSASIYIPTQSSSDVQTWRSSGLVRFILVAGRFLVLLVSRISGPRYLLSLTSIKWVERSNHIVTRIILRLLFSHFNFHFFSLLGKNKHSSMTVFQYCFLFDQEFCYRVCLPYSQTYARFTSHDLCPVSDHLAVLKKENGKIPVSMPLRHIQW